MNKMIYEDNKYITYTFKVMHIYKQLQMVTHADMVDRL